MQNQVIRAVLFAVLTLFMCANDAMGEHQKYKVYLELWTVVSVDGGVQEVNLTDPIVFGTCLDGYTRIEGTDLCGKDIKVVAQRDPVWFPDAKSQEVDVHYEVLNGVIRPYIPLNWGQYEMAVQPFNLHPAADPLGELEYRFTAVLKLKDVNSVPEIIGRAGDNPFTVEAVEQPMTVNVEVVMEPRDQPRAAL